ncbi:MAG: hypothetical protein R3C58_06620 [Parvularculaceae bacterium]
MVSAVCSSCSPSNQIAERLAERLHEKQAEARTAAADRADKRDIDKREAVRTERSDAVGQATKSAIAEARDNGADLPKNVQGKVASGIARGADAQSVFAAIVVRDDAPAEPAEAPAPVEEVAPADRPVSEAAPAPAGDEPAPEAPPVEADEPPSPPPAATTDPVQTSNLRNTLAILLGQVRPE